MRGGTGRCRLRHLRPAVWVWYPFFSPHSVEKKTKLTLHNLSEANCVRMGMGYFAKAGADMRRKNGRSEGPIVSLRNPAKAVCLLLAVRSLSGADLPPGFSEERIADG